MGDVDRVDWHILTELQADARLSFNELSRRVKLSAPAVADRVRRLEDAGVVTGYHAHVDLERIGRPVRAVVVATLVMEVFVGYWIRDNLTLNIIMLLYPLAAIRQWQSGGM